VLDDAAPLPQPVDARAHDLGAAGEHRVLGDRHQERAVVDVAVAHDGLQLERRPARMRGVDDVGVVHDRLEHRHAPDDHASASTIQPP
jgi:hypothetical protein